MRRTVRQCGAVSSSDSRGYEPSSGSPRTFSYVDVDIRSGTPRRHHRRAHLRPRTRPQRVNPADQLLDPVVLGSQMSALFALVRDRAPSRGGWPDRSPRRIAVREALRDRQSVRLHVSYAVTGAPGLVAVRPAVDRAVSSSRLRLAAIVLAVAMETPLGALQGWIVGRYLT